MMNYVWGGLIAFSLVFALSSDIADLTGNTYGNGRAVTLVVELPDGYHQTQRRQNVRVHFDATELARRFPDVGELPAYDGVWVQTTDGSQLRFAAGTSLPEPLALMRGPSDSNDHQAGELVATLLPDPGDDWQRLETGIRQARVAAVLPVVRFAKLSAVAHAAIDFAETAVRIALSLIGVLALWLGLLRIAERAGAVGALVRLVRPLLRPLFPRIPRDHPALGMIALNLSANVLGLGNAATPMGLKAMEELHKLNPSDDTATDDMVTFLALNTSSVQLLPPALLVALLGLQIQQLFVTILLATAVSTVVGIAAARLLRRLPSVRASDPQVGSLEASTRGEV